MSNISQQIVSVDSSTVCAPGQVMKMPAAGKPITITTSLGSVTGVLSPSANPRQLYFAGKSAEAKKLHQILTGASKASPLAVTLDFVVGEE